MKPVEGGETPQTVGLVEGNLLYPIFLGIQFDHQKDRPVIETGWNGGHDDHIQVGDLQNSAMRKAAAPRTGGERMARCLLRRGALPLYLCHTRPWQA